MDQLRDGKLVEDMHLPSLDNLMDDVHRRFWYDIVDQIGIQKLIESSYYPKSFMFQSRK